VHTTVSVIKVDVGSLAGHVKVPEELLKLCETSLSRALRKGVIEDFRVTSCGDDIELIMSQGFQESEGKLLGPVDLFDDIAFDYSRRKAMEISDYMRRHGPFEPYLLHPEALEYTTLPQVIERLKKRFEPVE